MVRRGFREVLEGLLFTTEEVINDEATEREEDDKEGPEHLVACGATAAKHLNKILSQQL